MPEFYGELPCGKYGCVGHVDAEEQKEGLAVAVAGGDAADTEVLLLVAEAALHYGGAQVTDDTAGGRSVSPGMLLGKMRRKFIRHLLEWKQGADASELADGKALAIFFQKIVFCKR